MENSNQKQRHGCVTAWLILMILANAFVAFVYLFMGDTISQNLPDPIPNYMLLLLSLVAALNILFAFMLLKWKKWAFWGFAISSILALGINLSLGLGIGSSLAGLLGLAILYGILQIKQDGVSAWNNLD